MKCLSAFRDPRGKGWLNCDRRTHFAASRLRPGWAYELRYCPECYERTLGLPCPPPARRGDPALPHFKPLDIQKKGAPAPTTTPETATAKRPEVRDSAADEPDLSYEELMAHIRREAVE